MKMKTPLIPLIYKFTLDLNSEDKKTADYIIKFVGDRPKGGTDTGHLVSLEENNRQSLIIVKAGITLSLLRQVAEHYLNNDNLKIEKKLSKFIPNDYFRLLNQPTKPEIGKEIYDSFCSLVKDNQVFTSVLEGIKKGESINVYDIYNITLEMVKYNALLPEYIGLPALFDVINCVFSQNIVNLYHATYLNIENIPTAMVLMETDKSIVYIGSKMLHGDIIGFDHLIKQIFVSTNKTIAEATEAFSILISTNGLDGIFAAVLHRQIWGESADISPDNMLIVKEQEKFKVINIDLTGFRYERIHDSELSNQVRLLGWLNTINELNEEIIFDRLFDPSVFKDRYLNGIEEKEIIHQAVITSLKSVLLPKVKKEVNTVKNFYLNLNLQELKEALTEFSTEIYESFAFKPSGESFEQVVNRNNNFLSDLLEHMPPEDVSLCGDELA